MKKTASLFLALSLLVLPLLSCAKTGAGAAPSSPLPETLLPQGDVTLPSAQPISDRDGEAPRADLSETFVSAEAETALSLFSHLYQKEGDTMLLSPLSVSLALAMTANGAKGATLAELERFLGGETEIGEFNRQFYTYVSSLGSSENARLKAADSIWYSGKNITPAEAFLETVKTFYAAEIRELDFSRADAADRVNDWVNEKTDRMIPSILEQNDVDAMTAMVLVNALSFDAKWKAPSDSAHDRVFTDGSGGETTLSFFSTRENAYIEGERETGFIKPYAGDRYAFLALLPEKGTDLSDYIASLDGKKYLALVNGAKEEPVNVTIPEFTADYKTDLAEILPALGVHSLFSAEADLSALSADGERGFSVSKILHKTRIEMTRAGTRAAAATAVIVQKNAASFEKIPSVVLDRPFVYAIVDTATGLPVFLGCFEG